MKKITLETIQRCAISVCITAPSVPPSDARFSLFAIPLLPFRPSLPTSSGPLTQFRSERCTASNVPQFCSLARDTRDVYHYLAWGLHCDDNRYVCPDGNATPVFRSPIHHTQLAICQQPPSSRVYSLNKHPYPSLMNPCQIFSISLST